MGRCPGLPWGAPSGLGYGQVGTFLRNVRLLPPLSMVCMRHVLWPADDIWDAIWPRTGPVPWERWTGRLTGQTP